jgi:hypothetical protein
MLGSLNKNSLVPGAKTSHSTNVFKPACWALSRGKECFLCQVFWSLCLLPVPLSSQSIAGVANRNLQVHQQLENNRLEERVIVICPKATASQGWVLVAELGLRSGNRNTSWAKLLLGAADWDTQSSLSVIPRSWPIWLDPCFPTTRLPLSVPKSDLCSKPGGSSPCCIWNPSCSIHCLHHLGLHKK